MIGEKFQLSEIVDGTARLPQFTPEEVDKGKLLGKGFFGIVYEIKGFKVGGEENEAEATGLVPKNQKKRKFKWVLSRLTGGDKKFSTFINDNADPAESEKPNKAQAADARSFMTKHSLRSDGRSRYAIKVLRPEILEDPTKLYYQGIMDINSETRLLSSVQHPNIIKLRAIAKGKTRFHETYFIVIDRLYDVLEERVKAWRRKLKRNDGFMGKLVLDRDGGKRAALWEDRIYAASELASALAYLHSKRIIHRDLKGDNIGFDIRGDIKLFDFGLARELPPVKEADADGTWKMTGATGTPRYMSGEVAMNRPYNESCDTYSFCMLLWEMLALKTPFELYGMKTFTERVWRAPYKRPPIDDSWPEPIRLLLKRGWCAFIEERQPMEDVADILRREVLACRGGGTERSFNQMERRSTFVWDEDEMNRSHKSLFSLLSSPFAKKSPFVRPSKPTLEKGLDTTAETQDCFSPTERMDLSSSSRSSFPKSFAARSPRPSSLPFRPPLLVEDDNEDEDDDANESPTKENPGGRRAGSDGMGFNKENHMTGQGSSTRDPCFSSSDALWDRIEQEKARRQELRTRLSSLSSAQAA